MANIEDIKDEGSLAAWLKDQPQTVSVAIATRAALRVGPILWTDVGFNRQVDLTPLPYLRCLLISGVAAVSPTPEINPEIREVADSATRSAARSAANSVVRSAAAELAAFAAAFAADSATSAADSTAFAARSAAISAAADFIWSEIRGDCSLGETAAAPLWHGENLFIENWHKTRALWQAAGPDWKFWIDWYEAILEGRAQNIEMLTEIALIDPEDWDKGEEHVNTMIAGIVAGYSGELDIDATLEAEIAATPKPSSQKTDATKKALAQNLGALPASFDAVQGFIMLEIERLQHLNYQSDEIRDEALRQIRSLSILHETIARMHAAVPAAGPVSDEQAEQVEKLSAVFLRNITDWPRKNAEDFVDSTFRFAIVGAATLMAPMIGIGATTAFIGAGAFFGGKKIVDALKLAGDTVNLTKPGA